ncbi:O-antigen ligase family protein [Pseudomonas guineae]|uniref:O-antigen ligase family protein n=1 Tax=Pseudomonas guineae TaxID=425504 RepID=UPI003D00AA30
MLRHFFSHVFIFELWVRALLFLGLIGFSLSCLESFVSLYSWHDQQRIAQIVLLCIGGFLSLFTRRQVLSSKVFGLVFVVFALGTISSVMAEYPEWAFKEWARYLGMFLLAGLIGVVARDARVKQYILVIVIVVGGLSAFQFYNYYVMALFTGILRVDPFFLLYGFDNPRFLGQFQIVLLPVLAVSVASLFALGRNAAGFGCLIVLVAQWCLVWALAGRGVWLGLFLSHVGLFCISRKFNRLIALQFFSAICGLLIFILLFLVFPYLYGIDAGLHDGVRFDLSGRETLWWGALSMAWSNPILGVGPMHFSAVWNHIGAHPHQWLLLLLAEWGGVSTILILSLVVLGLLRGVSVLRAQDSEFIDAGLWLALSGAFVLAQVDGVLVMPYAETWLVVVVGLAMSRWTGVVVVTKLRRMVIVFFAISVLFVLGRVLIFEAPNLMRLEEDFFQKHSIGSPPRFWAQGWIPM